MKRRVGVFLVLLPLSACATESRPSENELSNGGSTQLTGTSTSQSQSVQSFTTKATRVTAEKADYYRQALEKARDKQQQYINSLPEADRNSVQTAHGALIAKSNELILYENADAETINQIVTELTAPAQQTIDEKEAYYRQALEKARDKQQQHINSLPEADQNSVQTAHGALIAKSNELILYENADPTTINRLVSELMAPNRSVKKEAIAKVMRLYAKEKSAKYHDVTPATVKLYYGLSVPEEILANAYVDMYQIAFQFYDMQFGNGETYQLHAAYISASGQELILFAEKDGKSVVFHTTAVPANGKVQLDISQHHVLNEAIQE